MDNTTFETKNFQANAERREELKKKGVIIINEPFLDQSMEKFYFDLDDLKHSRTVDEIKIYVHSPGGYDTSMFPLIDLIDSIKKPVHTIALGHACSAAAFLVMCGHKGYRKAHRHTEFLLHTGGTKIDKYTKTSQIEAIVDSLRLTDKYVIELIKERTKMKDKDIKKYMGALDEYIRANDALKYGIIDEII